jgi:hypothetical protein
MIFIWLVPVAVGLAEEVGGWVGNICVPDGVQAKIIEDRSRAAIRPSEIRDFIYCNMVIVLSIRSSMIRKISLPV